jgi:tyrosyl-tRNA synthetase
LAEQANNFINLRNSYINDFAAFIQKLPEILPFITILGYKIDRLLAGHPKEAKLALGKAVIGEYHGATTGGEAAAQWQREIGEKAMPEEIATVVIAANELVDGKLAAAKLLVRSGLCATTSDARRAIAQGGAYIGEEKARIESHDTPIAVENGVLLWVGKKRVVRLSLGN